MIHKKSLLYILGTAILIFCLLGGQAFSGDDISFSGSVKKVLVKKNKVAIKDPVNKKRFTVIINDQSKLTGYSGIADIKKGDAVSGKYVVTDKGLYIATELAKK